MKKYKNIATTKSANRDRDYIRKEENDKNQNINAHC